MRIYLFVLFTGIIISCTRSPRFELLDFKQTGIDFNNTIVETDSFNILTYENIYNGAGLGIADLNNDGLPDLIFAGNQVSPKVYLNKGNFKFKDITSRFKGVGNDQWYCGISVVDINSDGWLDVYITSTGGGSPDRPNNRLWINSGIIDGEDPVFTEQAEKFGIADGGQSAAAAFFDYDQDGDLDLYTLNNALSERMNTSYRVKVSDGSSPNNDKLFNNNGDGTFTEVTTKAGIVFEGFGLGLALGDVNKDGFTDIYISNDYIANDILYINQGNGTFRNEIKEYFSYQTTSSMGNDMADINNDGNLDMFTLDMLPESYYKRKQTINGFSYIYYLLDDEFGYERQYLRNMLHLHNGFLNGEMLPFSEVGQLMGIYQSEWSWSPLFADFDNDGDKDLFIANGYPRDLTDKDWVKYKPKNQGFSPSNEEIINMIPPVKVPNIAFENIGDAGFNKRTDWLPQIPSYSYGASFVDLDNDGDLDYVVNNVDDRAFIIRNNSVENSPVQSNFIRIRLIGEGLNTMGIGAKIEIWNEDNYQFTSHFLTRGYASSVDPTIHFGLSNHPAIDSIRVTWPSSGKTSTVKNIKANQTIEINEVSSDTTLFDLPPSVNGNLIFTKSQGVVNYTHEQNDFIDFMLNQKIIPHKFSQIGPCMAKGDIDGDGLEDIIIGATNKLPTTVLLRRGSKFIDTKFEGLTTIKEFSESDLAVLDIDGDGDNDVIIVAGGYESQKENIDQDHLYRAVAGGYDIQNESEYNHYLYENQNGAFIRKKLPVPPFLASVVRPFDWDHDGDIEFFIGSRVKKGKFPYANYSWFIDNDNGKLSLSDDSKILPGMVTDAIWTDYDNDGWEDLLVSLEWNSPVLIKNVNGKKMVPQAIPSLEKFHGFWYSLASGDFDQDGDEDYIVGNLGDNNRFSITEKYPFYLYAVDLDMDGILDPLITGFWKDKDGKYQEYPLNYLDELREQSGFFQTKFDDFASFSYRRFDEMLDENMSKQVEFRLHVNTTSSYILWNDLGRFRWEKLAVAVQYSPVKRIIVQDINDDNWPDIIMGGNDYTYEVGVGYYDANKGLVLINNGYLQEKGLPAFKVLSPSESGFFLQGMVESLLYIKGDTSMIIAGINREKIEVFKKMK